MASVCIDQNTDILPAQEMTSTTMPNDQPTKAQMTDATKLQQQHQISLYGHLCAVGSSVQSVPTWVWFLLGMAAIVVMMAMTPSPQNAIVCVKIVYMKQIGLYTCMNQDLQLVPIVDAQKVTPTMICPDHLRDSLEVFRNKEHQHFVASTYQLDSVRFIARYSGFALSAVSARKPELPHILSSCIVSNTLGKNCTLPKDESLAKSFNSLPMLLYFAMSDSTLQKIAYSCGPEEIVFSSLMISRKRQILAFGNNRYLIGPEHEKSLTAYRSQVYRIGSRSIFVQVKFLSDNEFELIVSLDSISCIKTKYHQLDTTDLMMTLP